MPLVLLTGVPAILLGHLALRKIGRSFEEIPGGHAAKTGLRIGYVVALIIPLLILAVPVYSAWSATAEQKAGDDERPQDRHHPAPLFLRTMMARILTRKPPVHTSNAVFHRLFISGVCDDEMIFGCPQSPQRTGWQHRHLTDYKQALTKGENHWAMTAGLNDLPPAFTRWCMKIPWMPAPRRSGTRDVAGQPAGTLSWADGKVAIGFNDSAVVMLSLAEAKGASVPLKANEEGKEIFPTSPRPLTIFNVDP